MNRYFGYFIWSLVYCNLRKVCGKKVFAATCDEVLDNLEDISSLEVLGGVAAEYQIIAGFQGVSYNVMYLNRKTFEDRN